MPELHWQKSTYSQEASACVYVATTPTGSILLRESDEPEVVLATGPIQLGSLIAALRTPASRLPFRTDGQQTGTSGRELAHP